ncbi:MAG: choice-of-anchor I family protein [Planctomycetaceae bacterium]|nr:choice-of-anchor I family protein [Planctomycetaceae bacterium]
MRFFTKRPLLVLLAVTLLTGCGSDDAASNRPLQVSVAAPSGPSDSEPSSTSSGTVLPAPRSRGDVHLTLVGRFHHGKFTTSAAEICAYDAASKRLFVVNGETLAIDVLDITDPSQPSLVKTATVGERGWKPNSIASRGGVIVAAFSAYPKQDPGAAVFLDTDGNTLKTIRVGSEPDMVTISPDGRWVLTANEGEPTDDYSRDPEGSVSLIDLSAGIESLTDEHVTTLGFDAFNAPLSRDARIRVFGPSATADQDFEPEYIAVSPDSKRAWVALQEANAFAVIDLETRSIKSIVSLGFKDYSLPENGFDASDKRDEVNIRPWPVKGMYQPDAIAAFDHNGETFLISANEGDHRNFAGFQEEARVSDLKLDPKAFPNAAELQRKENLGRLMVTKTLGDANGDGEYEELYSFGGRSFSIWSAAGELVFDSGSEFERIIAERHPGTLNADHESNDAKNRSDNKGPEPEGLTIGRVGDRLLAFIGLERHSGIMIYDLADPRQPTFVDYVITRDFSRPPNSPDAGDLGPEGLTFIPAEQSPTGKPLLAVSYEVSSTTSLFEVSVDANERSP